MFNPSLEPEPSATAEYTTEPSTEVSLNRLPPEIVGRVAEILAHERTPDKSNYSALCALQRTSRSMYMMTTPHIWKEYEGDLFGFYRLLRLFKQPGGVRNEVLVSAALTKEDREQHPIDWSYSTRLIWASSHLTRLTYRPIVECRVRWQTILYCLSATFGGVAEGFDGRYLDKEDPTVLFFPALQTVVLDASRYEGLNSKRANVISSREALARDKTWSGGLGLVWQDQGREYLGELSKKCLVDVFLCDVLARLRPRQICVRLGTVLKKGYSTLSSLDFVSPSHWDEITLHDSHLRNSPNNEIWGSRLTWSFPSQCPPLERHEQIGRVIKSFRHDFTTLYLAKPETRADETEAMLNEEFKQAKGKWEWLENDKDGVPRCRCCGDEIF